MVVSVVARNETTRLLAKMGVCRLDVVRTERASRSAADSASPAVCVHIGSIVAKHPSHYPCLAVAFSMHRSYMHTGRWECSTNNI